MPQAVPVRIDPELTPPPQEPPPPASIEGYEDIAPPIRLQLDMLAKGLGDLTVAMGRVWDARKDAEWLPRIDEKLATLADYAIRHQTLIDENVLPRLNQLASSSNEVALQLPRILAQVEASSIVLASVELRLRALEVDVRVNVERLQADDQAAKSRLAAIEVQVKSNENRISTLERESADKRAVDKALAKRERRKAGGMSAVVAAVVAAIAAAIQQLT